MPLFSEHISNMYYSGSSHSAPYSSYSSVSPLGSSYSASYLNSGGNYSSHSSLGGYSRPPPLSRWVTSSGRNYAPMLSTISERSSSSPVRLNSPRRIPYTNRNYATPTYTPRPININTADIDVSRDRYRNKPESTPTPPPPPPPIADGENGPFMPRVDGKPETGIDSSPGPQRSTIRRGRTVVRLHTVKRKDRDSPRKPQSELDKQQDDDSAVDGITSTNAEDGAQEEPVRWREKLSEDLTYKDKREKKTLGAKLVEKFIVKDKDSDSEDSIKRTKRNQEVSQSLPTTPIPTSSSAYSRSPDRRCSVEMLAEQANLLDTLIRGENLCTTALDLSKVGIAEPEENKNQRQTSIKRRKSKDQENPLQTTQSDYSLHDSLNSFKDPKRFSKKRSLRKSSSGGSICRLDSIKEFPKEPFGELPVLPPIVENKIVSTKRNSVKRSKPKLKKPIITSSVEVTTPPKSPLKFRVDVTVEETPRSPKKEIIYSSVVEDAPGIENPKMEIKTPKKYTKTKTGALLPEPDDVDGPSPEPEDGNFWDKIGKRETVYLIRRKQYIEDVREKNRRALFWFPEEEETEGNERTGTDNTIHHFNSNTCSLESNEEIPDTSAQNEIVNAKQDTDPNDQFLLKNDVIQESEKCDVITETFPVVKTLSKEKKTNSLKKESEEPLKANKNITEPKNNDKNIKDESKITTELQKMCKTALVEDKSKVIADEKINDLQNENHKEKQNITVNSAINKNELDSELKEQLSRNSDKVKVDGTTTTDVIINKKATEVKPQKQNSKEKISPQVSNEIPDKEKNIKNTKIKTEDNFKGKKSQDTDKENKLPTPTVTGEINEVKKIENKQSPKKEETPNKKVNESKPPQVTKNIKVIEKSSSEKTCKSNEEIQNKVTVSTSTSDKEVNKTSGPLPKVETKTEVNEQPVQKEETIVSGNDSSKTVSISPSTEITTVIKEEKTVNDGKLTENTNKDANTSNSIEVPIVIESENIPDKDTKAIEPLQETKTGEDIKAENFPIKVDKLEVSPATPLQFVKPVSSKKPVKDEPALRPLIATPRPLQKKSPQVIHSSSSSETSSSEESSDDDEDADESENSDGSNEFFECENQPDGRTSTGSNDSGFDSSAPTSPAGFVHVKKEQSTAYGLFRKTGRFTPPARSIPRFRKYNIEDFHFIKVLGKGSFGKVLLAELRDTEYYYAVKCLKKDVVLEDDDVECTLIERKVLALGTNHPYLCHLFATFQTDSHLFFVMEYLNGGDLMFHIQQSGRFPETRARLYAAEIVSGLKFLHKRGIVYRDLKLDNILLDFDGHVRIADFGMCKLQIYLDKTADTFCGTPDYMAPEIIKGLKYNQTVDWWSFGVLLYEMLIGQSPFSGCDEDELFWSICNEMPSYPRFLSQEALTILTRLLDKDARTRLGGTECMHGDVRDQDFFRPIHWDKLDRRELEAPFRPRVRHPLDTQYFDRAFTGERPRLTAVEPHVLRSMDQEAFRGFSYTNPNATDR
ncbi:uncharacterized protein LOC126366575 isoform X2 [Pectinophora gossypiella]|uniref:uncharacterized protein LOC126366575 isoform X2 n=1 Tax=Pectinophora gossypiella TaxID=13191 RepID=UPI00214F42B3|nr:uncharacterized protein LOC126366575 isoform X2 [Pectinophora gossypiella]